MNTGEIGQWMLSAAAIVGPVILLATWIDALRAGETYSSLSPAQRRAEHARGIAENTWADVLRFFVGLVLFSLAVEAVVRMVGGGAMLRGVFYLYGGLAVVLRDARRARAARRATRTSVASK